MNNQARQIKERDMKALAEYQAKLRKKPALRMLFFELTDVCNLNCLHCGSRCSGKNSAYLNFDLIRKTLRCVAEAYDPGKIMICLTGGEPLLYPRLNDVIAMAHAFGFPVGITTNGTLIDEAAAQGLAAAGLDTVAVSLDGIGDVHEAFRMAKGCYEKALRGIRALKAAGIEPQVLTVVHRKNLHQLDDVYALLKQMDIYSWRVVNVDPIGRANTNGDLLLNGAELKALYEYIRAKRFDPSNEMEVTYGCSHFVTLPYERMLRDFYFQCCAGTTVASITANGEIRACLDIERRPELIQGNAFTDDFVEVWENGFRFFRRDRTESSGKCRACEHRAICLGDSAHTWDYDANDPLYCVAKMLEGEPE